MTTKSWIKRGIRVNKMRSPDSRWGAGKVHMTEMVDRERPETNPVYEKSCRRLSLLDIILGGVASSGNVSKDEEVTCKRCRKIWGLDEPVEPVKPKKPFRMRQRKS